MSQYVLLKSSGNVHLVSKTTSPIQSINLRYYSSLSMVTSKRSNRSVLNLNKRIDVTPFVYCYETSLDHL